MVSEKDDNLKNSHEKIINPNKLNPSFTFEDTLKKKNNIEQLSHNKIGFDRKKKKKKSKQGEKENE